MKKELLNDMLVDLNETKEVFETVFVELMDKVDAITSFFGATEVETAPAETMQDRLNNILKANLAAHEADAKDIVSQFQEQLRQSIDVVEPAEEIVNESEETSVNTTSLIDSLRSQLTSSDSDNDEEVDNCDEEVDYGYDQEVYDEIEEAEEVTDIEDTRSSVLTQSFREQIALAELAKLPRPEEVDLGIHIPTTDLPNLSDVLRVQEAKPSLTEQLRQQMNMASTETEVVEEPSSPSLTMEQMIQQLRDDINNSSDAEDEKKEEELVKAVASSSNQEVSQSLRQQLLVQELKKQLK